MRQLNAIGKVKMRVPDFCSCGYGAIAELVNCFVH